MVREQLATGGAQVAGTMMIDGTSLFSLGAPLAIVLLWGAVSFTVALRIFRWR